MKGQVSFLVNKLHVGMSDKKVLRHFWERLVSNPANMTLENKQARKEVYRYALECHHENQELYRDVMTGRF